MGAKAISYRLDSLVWSPLSGVFLVTGLSLGTLWRAIKKRLAPKQKEDERDSLLRFLWEKQRHTDGRCGCWVYEVACGNIRHVIEPASWPPPAPPGIPSVRLKACDSLERHGWSVLWGVPEAGPRCPECTQRIQEIEKPPLPFTPPRYDDVYYEGMAILDEEDTIELGDLEELKDENLWPPT